MNIDIVNNQVATKLGIKEKDVALINKYYWTKVKEHIYSYSPKPLNITNICVFHPTAYLVKKQLKLYISLIRNTKYSLRFKENSAARYQQIEKYKEIIRKLWNIRKQNKYTN